MQTAELLPGATPILVRAKRRQACPNAPASLRPDPSVWDDAQPFSAIQPVGPDDPFVAFARDHSCGIMH